ncbi:MULTISPECIES: PE family protein [Mycobacterium]|uniref:PE domain-containing protein n=1 Tax=Mycobacterium kiyosense TaxID=2871094 RepID=A0A9P3Q8U9_9MYCO|nr:hypothetical protein IWGMT90018_58550 [Mycobacterium kiyosense]BDE16868.1 hypothetical protein MKCMC460_57280 [Mycobacterium sp. 20KCMC460]GLB86144.1 hypothetical protein SRL2020028_54000 [Mycobacterium kiyosense]GLB91100.1 hypothetical protein SRL2020130_39170 [Mycobacterium kiyosense]GLB96900.1 hypothetical protein SRL2020226_36760 [Mycobacterium kiyosense]
MSLVSAVPGAISTAAANVTGIGATISAANALAAAPTTAVLAAAGDQVSAAVAALFSVHAQTYQTLSEQAANFHAQFARAIESSANAYASAESANASSIGNVDIAKTGSAAGPACEYVGTFRSVAAERSAPGQTAAPTGTDRAASGAASAETGPVVAGGGSGGLLLGPSRAVVAGSAGMGSAAAGGSGGILSRLLQGGERRARAGGSGRVSAGTGVGVLLTSPQTQDTLRIATACSAPERRRLDSPA